MGQRSSKCPADERIRRKRQQAIFKKNIPSVASDFYFACRNDNIDYVREHIKDMSIEEINKLEPNGSTALHAATFYDNKEIVQLLISAKCSRTKLNRCGKMPHEEIQTAEMRKLYERPTLTRFHESDPSTSLATYVPDDQGQQQQTKLDWIKVFENENELMEYLTNQQTTVMWLKFFNWVSHTFSRFLDRNDYNANLFDLNNDRDFDDFLKRTIPNDDEYKQAREALIEAEQDESIIPLIELYTSEFEHGGIPFYQVLNKQLALSSENDINTAHFCDRFVLDFDMKSQELEKRAYIGVTYRGVTMNDADIEKYEQLSFYGRKHGIIATKTFQSTSKNKQVALRFAAQSSDDFKRVLVCIQNIEPMPNYIFRL
ncbi:unnamed protein product [Rotaria sp. Silwood2]|nr:unnamed protein product [Rotaria sp. Silwood2]CAF4073226.1 unnamed protein product [Rotaria sp. Silwood2]